MKKINLYSILVLMGLFWIQVSQSACLNDKLPEPEENPFCETVTITFDNQIQPIINGSCAIPGCHFVGASIGDYTDYVKMLPILNDNGFKKRVIEIMDMPEGDMLTPEEFEMVECWASSGYPEN